MTAADDFEGWAMAKDAQFALASYPSHAEPPSIQNLSDMLHAWPPVC